MTKKKAKIIVWDIETTPIKAYTWGLYPKAISHDNIIEDWTIICGAWKELGSTKTHSVSIKEVGNDYEVVKKLRDIVADADIIIHHNGDKFDLRKLNTRLIYYGLPPLPPIHTIDTLKQARKIASFTSNRLDYIAKMLLGEGKIPVKYELWTSVIGGSKKALKDMVTYCKKDVDVLEGVYNYLKPYLKGAPHIGAANGEDRNCSCRNCGGTDLKKNGTRFTAAGLKKQEIQCKGCGHYMRIPI